MYFSRLQLRLDDVQTHQLVAIAGRSDGYREHQALWRLFDGDSKASRDFLFRRDDRSSEPVYFVVSQRAPKDTSGCWHIETKSYAPQITKGQRLAFSLRINPVVTRRADADGKRKRHDLVMEQKRSLNWKTLSLDQRAPLHDLMQEAGKKWLNADRQERFGMHIDALQTDGYRMHRNYKRLQEKPISYSTLDLQGTLTVTDNDKLTKALFAGVGPARAFGCGLLLVRRL